MIQDAPALLREFLAAARKIGLVVPEEIEHESLAAPHTPPKLRAGRCAVYVFSLSETYGSRCAAGANRVLKVGKAGPQSLARFQSQHYSPAAAKSTLAGSLLNGKILWGHLGIKEISEANVRTWLLANTDRDHFFLPNQYEDTLCDLERFMRGRLGPVFEGG